MCKKVKNKTVKSKTVKKAKKKLKSGFQNKSNEYKILYGKIVRIYPDSRYSVELEEDKRVVNGFISGRMKINYIKIIPGDKVVVQISSYNDQICRIIRRV